MTDETNPLNEEMNKRIDNIKLFHTSMIKGETELKPSCPKCGDKCTTALAYFCKCGWEQIGNNHEAWLKQLAEMIKDHEKALLNQIEALEVLAEKDAEILEMTAKYEAAREVAIEANKHAQNANGEYFFFYDIDEEIEQRIKNGRTTI